MKKRGTPIWLFAAIVWTAVIFLLSTKTGAESNETSSSLASMVASIFVPDFSTWAPSAQAEWVSGMNGMLRKLAHFFEFGLLGALTYRTVLFLLGSRRRKKPATKIGMGMISFYICLAVSALDEFLQISSVGRNSTAGDMLIDCAGALLGIIICAYKSKLPDTAPTRTTPVRRRG